MGLGACLRGSVPSLVSMLAGFPGPCSSTRSGCQDDELEIGVEDMINDIRIMGPPLRCKLGVWAQRQCLSACWSALQDQDRWHWEGRNACE